MAEAQDPESLVRPRAAAWGSAADREAMQKIVEDVALRSGFRVCAIEVLRADEMLEFVAVSGSLGLAAMIGQGSPRHAKDAAFACGATYGPLTFVAEEWLSSEAEGVVAQYGYLPDLTDPVAPDEWRAKDMLAARLSDDSDRLRAVLYLDEPVTGLRPTSAELLTLAETLQLTFQAVVTTVEREALAQQVRIAQAARTMIRAASARLDLGDLLTLAIRELRDAFLASDLEIHLFDGSYAKRSDALGTETLRLDVKEAMSRAWRHEQVVIIEAGQVWGDDLLHARHCEEFTELLSLQGMGVLVLVPIGVAGHLMGVLVIYRTTGAARWTDSESEAAFDVGQDLASAMIKARAFESEHQLNAKLRRVDDYRQELISTVTHELKNPIGAVLGHLEMLESEPNLTERGQASLDAIERAATRLKILADDLLTLGRLRSTSSLLNALPIDLKVVLAEVIDSTEMLVEQQRVKLKIAESPHPMVVVGDPDDLLRVVGNLVSNAVKYSEAGGTVHLSLETVDDGVLFTCADEGIGISAVDQTKLFTEFFRSTNARVLALPGTGLGLPIVRRVVQRHHGRIDVESALGVGTTVRVWLPADTPADSR